MPARAYRADIDGLRGIAVLLVVFFHAGIAPFSGGFVGIDVFFVISGFLITSIILSEKGKGTFSLTGFYERRVRRIIPALLVVCFTVVAAASFLFLPIDFKLDGESAAAVSVFLSNVLFWVRVDYFDKSAALEPLLHTWSLGVEEQFYLGFPLLLAVLARWWRRNPSWPIFVILVASFALSAVCVVAAPRAAYYLAPQRAWELAVGALLGSGMMSAAATITNRLALSVTGAAFVLLPACLYTPQTPFPGAAALLPCAGTALLIAIGEGEGTPITRALGMRALTFIGSISYSLYLWHWPILVFARYCLVRELTITERIAAIVIATAFAAVTVFCVERPFRRRSFLTRRQLFILLGSFNAILLVLGIAIYLDEGAPWRFSPEIRRIAEETDYRHLTESPCIFGGAPELAARGPCRVGDGSKPDFLVWGDSHAEALASVFDTVARRDHRSGYVVAMSGCAPIARVEHDLISADCAQFDEGVLRFIGAHPEIHIVVLHALWEMYGGRVERAMDYGGVSDGTLNAASDATTRFLTSALQSVVERLLLEKRQVVLFGPVPAAEGNVPSVMLRARVFGAAVRLEKSRLQYDRESGAAAAILRRVADRDHLTVLWPSTILCGPATCAVQRDGHPYYVDDNHLDPEGAALLAPLVQRALSR